VAFGYPDEGENVFALRDQVRAVAAHLDHASVVLIGQARTGVLLRAASAVPVDVETLERIDACFALDRAAVARYDDARRNVGRRIRVAAGRLAAVRLCGDVQGDAWLREWLTGDRDVGALGAALLSPSIRPPGGMRLRGRVVCACHDVAETEIVAALSAHSGAADAALAAVQSALKCGTGCGSCMPELRRLASARRQAA